MLKLSNDIQRQIDSLVTIFIQATSCFNDEMCDELIEGWSCMNVSLVEDEHYTFNSLDLITKTFQHE